MFYRSSSSTAFGEERELENGARRFLLLSVE